MKTMFTMNDNKTVVTAYHIASASDLLKRDSLAKAKIVKCESFNSDVLYDTERVYIVGADLPWEEEKAFFIADNHLSSIEKKRYGIISRQRSYSKQILSKELSHAIYCYTSLHRFNPRAMAQNLKSIGHPSHLEHSEELQYIEDILTRTACIEKREFTKLLPLIEFILSFEPYLLDGDYQKDLEGLTLTEALTEESDIRVLKILKHHLSNSRVVQELIDTIPQVEEKAKEISMIRKGTN